MTTAKKAPVGEPPVVAPPDDPARPQPTDAATVPEVAGAAAAGAPRRRAPRRRAAGAAESAAAATPAVSPAAPASAAAESASAPATPADAGTSAAAATPRSRRGTVRRAGASTAADTAQNQPAEASRLPVVETTPAEGEPAAGAEAAPARRRRAARVAAPRPRRRKAGEGSAASMPDALAEGSEAASEVRASGGSTTPQDVVTPASGRASTASASPSAAASRDAQAAAPATMEPGADVSLETVAGAEAGQDAAKRRRRGHRGGRRRNKPAVTAGGDELTVDTASVQVAVSAPEESRREAATAPAEEGPPRRRFGRRTAAAAAAPAAASATSPPSVATSEAGAEIAGDVTGSASVPAAEETVAASAKRRRGTRGGRRAREARARATAQPAAADATAEAQAVPAATSPAEPAVAAAPAKAPRRRRGATSKGEAAPASADLTAAEAGSPAASAVAPAAAATPVAPAASATAAEEQPQEPVAEASKPARRRRGRGGEAKGGDGGSAAKSPEGQEPEAKPAAEGKPGDGKARPAEGQTQTRARRQDVRRPKAIVRLEEAEGAPVQPREVPARRLGIVAEQPERKTILVSDDGRELRVALMEDGRLAEIYIERPEKKSYLGDIYQGKVESVLGGIDAAFVDFGLEKNGFLYVDDVVTEGERRARRIGDALKQGQTVLVQVTKDPMGSKGARLSTKISLAGRYLVYVPGGSGVGVSRRLGQSERDRLRDISKELKFKNGGIIVRTLAEGHGLDDLKRDLQFLSRLWTRLKKKAETVSAPGLVHREADISLEVARDLFNVSVEKLLVDEPKRHKALMAFLTKVAPELAGRVELYEGEEPLFEAYKVDEQISRALERRVPLPSGGNLVIDHAEALTVIDVNSGRFTRGKGLEDTITKTNLEAAREAVRQLRLRDIGGIIIIDFIDMAHAHNRETVLETLEAELEMDRTKTYVVELSPLGLVEMTRQNTTDGARGILTRVCPCCSGKGRVLSEESMALLAERRIRALARRSGAKAWLFEVNSAVAERLSGDRLKRLEKATGRRIFFEGGSGLPVDTFRLLAEGPLLQVQAQRVPVREGQEVEVELEYTLSYSPRDAVGYVDGYMVVVEGGQGALGERRRVRITATSRACAEGILLKDSQN